MNEVQRDRIQEMILEWSRMYHGYINANSFEQAHVILCWVDGAKAMLLCQEEQDLYVWVAGEYEKMTRKLFPPF